MYLRRAGWTDQRQFSIQTVAGEIRPTILGPTHLPRRHGPRDAALGQLPARRRRRHRRGRAAAASSTSRSATRSARSGSPTRRAGGAGPRGRGPAGRARPALPEPHERVVLERPARRRSARGSSSAGWGNAVVGHRGVRRRRRLRAARGRLHRHGPARRWAARGRRRRGVAARRPDRAGRCQFYRAEVCRELLDELRLRAAPRAPSSAAISPGVERAGVASRRSRRRSGSRRHAAPSGRDVAVDPHAWTPRLELRPQPLGSSPGIAAAARRMSARSSSRVAVIPSCICQKPLRGRRLARLWRRARVGVHRQREVAEHEAQPSAVGRARAAGSPAPRCTDRALEVAVHDELQRGVPRGRRWIVRRASARDLVAAQATLDVVTGPSGGREGRLAP